MCLSKLKCNKKVGDRPTREFGKVPSKSYMLFDPHDPRFVFGGDFGFSHYYRSLLRSDLSVVIYFMTICSMLIM